MRPTARPTATGKDREPGRGPARPADPHHRKFHPACVEPTARFETIAEFGPSGADVPPPSTLIIHTRYSFAPSDVETRQDPETDIRSSVRRRVHSLHGCG